jgi:hypothetical protein
MPRTKRAIKRPLELLEKQIEFIEGGATNISPLVSFSKETPSFVEHLLDNRIKET